MTHLTAVYLKVSFVLLMATASCCLFSRISCQEIKCPFSIRRAPERSTWYSEGRSKASAPHILQTPHAQYLAWLVQIKEHVLAKVMALSPDHAVGQRSPRFYNHFSCCCFQSGLPEPSSAHVSHSSQGTAAKPCKSPGAMWVKQNAHPAQEVQQREMGEIQN